MGDVECGMQVLGGRSYMDYSSQNNNKQSLSTYPAKEDAAGPIVTLPLQKKDVITCL